MQPNDVDLSVDVGPLRLRNPILTASGTFGYGSEFEDILDLSSLGGIVTKSLSRLPRPGNPTPRIAETPSGMLNAIGLENCGLDAFLEHKLPVLRRMDTAREQRAPSSRCSKRATSSAKPRWSPTNRATPPFRPWSTASSWSSTAA